MCYGPNTPDTDSFYDGGNQHERRSLNDVEPARVKCGYCKSVLEPGEKAECGHRVCENCQVGGDCIQCFVEHYNDVPFLHLNQAKRWEVIWGVGATSETQTYHAQNIIDALYKCAEVVLGFVPANLRDAMRLLRCRSNNPSIAQIIGFMDKKVIERRKAV